MSTVAVRVKTHRIVLLKKEKKKKKENAYFDPKIYLQATVNMYIITDKRLCNTLNFHMNFTFSSNSLILSCDLCES